MKQLALRLPDEMRDEIEADCKENGTNLSAWVKEACRMRLDRLAVESGAVTLGEHLRNGGDAYLKVELEGPPALAVPEDERPGELAVDDRETDEFVRDNLDAEEFLEPETPTTSTEEVVAQMQREAQERAARTIVATPPDVSPQPANDEERGIVRRDLPVAPPAEEKPAAPQVETPCRHLHVTSIRNERRCADCGDLL